MSGEPHRYLVGCAIAAPAREGIARRRCGAMPGDRGSLNPHYLAR
jgi:hypothetical protein